jgi:4-aminobutyrate---pyruvate transaminase
MAGLWCTSLGYANEELIEAATSQMRKLSFGHLLSGHSHDSAVEVAEALQDMAPFRVSKAFSPLPDRRPTTPRSSWRGI